MIQGNQEYKIPSKVQTIWYDTTLFIVLFIKDDTY
jgi:hypothetical protein